MNHQAIDCCDLDDRKSGYLAEKELQARLSFSRYEHLDSEGGDVRSLPGRKDLPQLSEPQRACTVE